MTNPDQLGATLLLLVILAFLLERALAPIFDMKKLEPILSERDLKAPIAIVVSLIVCFFTGFDVMKAVMASCTVCGTESLPSWLGIGITGFVVAGGSAGAVKLFQDVLGFRRSARQLLNATAELDQQAAKQEAQARLEKAATDITQAKATRQVVLAQAVSGVTGGGDAGKQLARLRLANRYHAIVTGQADA